MEIVVYTNSARTRTCFDAIERSRKYALAFEPLDGLDGWLKNGRNGTPSLVYVDLTGSNDAAAVVKRLSRANGKPFCIIDARNSVEDPAGLFRSGAVDYVGRSVFVAGITVKRIDEVVSFVRNAYPEPAPGHDEPSRDGSRNEKRPASTTRFKLSGDTWDSVQLDREYTFAMLFAELDNVVDYEAKTSLGFTASLSEAFSRLVEREVAPYQGRLWMWRDYGGLVLFPFNGKSCPALVSCIRLVLNRPIENVQSFHLNTPLSFRLALHLGNTVYRHKGETGHIVSDSVNFIHHLGQKFTPPSAFTITSEVHRLVPPGLADLFVPLGNFEHRSIYRMRLPVKPR
ncbi:MAG: hypothetical protein EA403_07140 [Spirochaetaceae bacterium]|nr:MAG: hypothetical protein EA403_07140 [Spirochaetaceae bacterium]